MIHCWSIVPTDRPSAAEALQFVDHELSLLGLNDGLVTGISASKDCRLSPCSSRSLSPSPSSARSLSPSHPYPFTEQIPGAPPRDHTAVSNARPSGTGIPLALFFFYVPVVYKTYHQLTRLACARNEVSVSFILVGIACMFSLLFAFVITVSAWIETGCKNPYGRLDDVFKRGLPGRCSARKAGDIFFWLAFSFWLVSLTLLIIDWRSGTLTTPPRDAPFTRPDADIEEGEEHKVEECERSYQLTATNTAPKYPRQATYDNSNTPASPPFTDSNRLSTVPTDTSTSTTSLPPTNRFSTADSSANRIPAYSSAPTTTTAPTTSTNMSNVFSDPAPSELSGPLVPRVSRMMQYADSHVAVRATSKCGRSDELRTVY
ncbi:hypothetical protein BDR05DRAFT_898022 [Suillus weaverae]|nr:hypothetical protein BDR05DRAFT_898022 [Suillus weaverae]